MGQYSKFIIAVIGSVIGWATLVVQSPARDITSGEWIVLLAGAATALGVYVAPNVNNG